MSESTYSKTQKETDQVNLKEVEKKTRFPKHWGNPPVSEIKELVRLPGTFGLGCIKLRSWIIDNINKDVENRRPLPEGISWAGGEEVVPIGEGE